MPSPPKKTFGPTKRLTDAYAKGLRQITGRILKPITPSQTLDEWLQELHERSQQADIQEASVELSKRLYQWTAVSNARTWREAAAKSQKSRQLYAYLQKELTGTSTGHRVNQLIAQNANYISSLPLDAARTLISEVTKAQQSGARAGTVAKMMRSRFPILLRSRVQLISRTETSKAATALTRARSEDLELPCYIWRTSKDARVRHSHDKMEGVLVFWSDPPAPDTLFPMPLIHGGTSRSTLGHYHAGDAPNDRCYPEPILDINDVKWSCRVYSQGSIKMMTKPAFLKAFASALKMVA
jgi:SPP1 gp7 family putative phage head morphogenesis protein